MKRFWSFSSFRSVMAALVLAGCTAAIVSEAAFAQRSDRRDRDKEANNKNRVFSADTGEKLLAVQELLVAEQMGSALTQLNTIVSNSKKLSPYELGVILLMRGNVKWQLDDSDGALSDWRRALTDGDLNDKERLSTQYNIGQITLVKGNYREAIQILEQWIADGGQVTDKVYLNLVAAYAELGDYRGALRHALSAYQIANPRERKHFDMLNFLYMELNMPRERAQILQEMVALFPEDEKIWLSIAALYAEGGEEQKAFEINKIMYINGMLTEEKEIMRVVDYYSFLEVPYRGARILEREMNRGRVAKTRDNYEKLARFYRQAQEFDLAVPPLNAAASMSNDGQLYEVLGQALYAEGEFDKAERSLRSALNKGGLKEPGNAWVLIGNSLYDSDRPREAIDAFRRGSRYGYSEETANNWIKFVEGELLIQHRQEEFKKKVRREEIRLACERRFGLIGSGGLQSLTTREADIVTEVEEENVPEVLVGIDCDQILAKPAVYPEELRPLPDPTFEQEVEETVAAEGETTESDETSPGR